MTGESSALPPPALADGTDRSLDPRVIQLHQAIGWIFAAIVGGGALVVLLLVWLVSDLSRPVLLGLAASWIVAAAGLCWLAQVLAGDRLQPHVVPAGR